MGKSVYSLILSDEIVEKVDEKAAMLGTNRSAMINEILAKYVSYVTPEQEAKQLYRLISSEMSQLCTSFRFLSGEDSFMAVAALKYKYNPSIKYGLTLYSDKSEKLGEIRAVIRTKNSDLLNSYTLFCEFWHGLEAKIRGSEPEDLYGYGSYRRVLKMPRYEYSAEQIAAAVTSYIALFDSSFKKHLRNGNAANQHIAAEYESAYSNGKII